MQRGSVVVLKKKKKKKGGRTAEGSTESRRFGFKTSYFSEEGVNEYSGKDRRKAKKTHEKGTHFSKRARRKREVDHILRRYLPVRRLRHRRVEVHIPVRPKQATSRGLAKKEEKWNKETQYATIYNSETVLPILTKKK